jgi:hypothetical protein
MFKTSPDCGSPFAQLTTVAAWLSLSASHVRVAILTPRVGEI